MRCIVDVFLKKEYTGTAVLVLVLSGTGFACFEELERQHRGRSSKSAAPLGTRLHIAVSVHAR